MASDEAERLILTQYHKDTWHELLKEYLYIMDKIPIKDLQGRITMHSEFPIRWNSWNNMSRYMHSDNRQTLESVILSVLGRHHSPSSSSIEAFVQYGVDLFSQIVSCLMYDSNKETKLQFYEGELLDHPVSIVLFISPKDYTSQDLFLDRIGNLIRRFTEEYSWTKEGWMESNILIYCTLVYNHDQYQDPLLDKCFAVLRNTYGLDTCLFQLDQPNQGNKKFDHFIFDFVKNHLIPYMERTILHLNIQLSTYRKSTASRFFSASKKYFSTGGFRSGTVSPTESTIISEPTTKSNFRFHRDTPEFQMRRLADYAFILRDYKLCYTVLDSLKRDFQIPKNSSILMSIVEWIHIASLMSDSLSVDDKQYFDLYSSYHRSKLYALSFRSLYIHLESLIERQLYTDAFSSLQKLTGSDTPDILNALLLERMAVIFLSLTSYQLMKRKAMFYYTLSSHHYEKTNDPLLLSHASRTEEHAEFLLPRTAWATLHDHLHYTIGKLSRDQKQWPKALYHIQKLVKDTRNFYRPFQSSYIREFLHLHMTSTEWFTDVDIPSIDLNFLSIENHPAMCIDLELDESTNTIQHSISRQDSILVNITMTNHSVVKYSIYDLSLMIQQEDGVFTRGTILDEIEFINPHMQHCISLSFKVNTLPESCSSFRILGLSYNLGQQHISIYRELHRYRDILYKIVMKEHTLNVVWKDVETTLIYDGSKSLLSSDSDELYQGQLYYRQLMIDMNEDRPETDFQFKLIYKDDTTLDIPFYATVIPPVEQNVDWSSNIASFSMATSEWKSIHNSSVISLCVSDHTNMTILYPPVILVIRYVVRSSYRYMRWSLYKNPIYIVPALTITHSFPFYDVAQENETECWNAKFLIDCQGIRNNIYVTGIQTIGLRHVLNDSGDSYNRMLNHLNSGHKDSLPESCRFVLNVSLKNRCESLSHLNQILDWLKTCFFIQDSEIQKHSSLSPVRSGSNLIPESLVLLFHARKRQRHVKSIFQNETPESKLVSMLENVIPVLDHQSFILLLSWKFLESDIKGINISQISFTEHWHSYFTGDWLNSKLRIHQNLSDIPLFTQGLQDKKRIINALTNALMPSLHSRLLGYLDHRFMIHATLYLYNESACKQVDCRVLLDHHQQNSDDTELPEISLCFHWLGQQLYHVNVEPLETKTIKLEGLLLPDSICSYDEKRAIQLCVWIIDDQGNKRKESCMIMTK